MNATPPPLPQSAPPPPQPPPPPPIVVPPAGWYYDGIGMRWWDGAAWGPAAPGAGYDSSDKTLSILSHGGLLLGGFIFPLVLYLTADEHTRPETRWHARESLNFQLTFLVAYFGSFIVFFVGVIAAGVFGAAGTDTGAGVGFGLSLVFSVILLIGSITLNVVFSIIGAVRANEGVRWKYPIQISFVRP